MKFNKLVRDRIPEIIEKDGKKAITRILDDEEYKIYLEKKLDEEVAEFHESKSLEELADIYEVLAATCYAYGHTFTELDALATEKRLERGGFRDKILLEKICEVRKDSEDEH